MNFFLVDSPEQISWGNSRLAFVNSWLDRFFSMIADLWWLKLSANPSEKSIPLKVTEQLLPEWFVDSLSCKSQVSFIIQASHSCIDQLFHEPTLDMIW